MIPLRFALLAAGAAVPLIAAVILPRVERAPDRFSVAMDLIADGRASDAVHLLDDRIWRGIAEFRANRLRRATTEFVQGEDITSLYNLGTTYARLGEWGASRAAYEKVLSLDPGHEDAAFNLSLVLQAAAQQRAEEEAQRQTRTVGAEKGETGTETALSDTDGEQTTSEDAAPSEQAAATEQVTDKAGQITAAGRTGETATSPDPAAGRSADESAGEADASGRPGAGGMRRIESADAAETLLRAIRDDPARVLAARLRAMDRLRREGAR